MKTNKRFPHLKHYIRQADIYGHQISLTYKSSPYYQSFFGGLVSILTRLFILGYFLY